MGLDNGKSAKKLGKDRARNVRRLEAPTPARSPGLPGVPPHKLPRVYLLKVVETTVSVAEQTHRYESKKEREEAIARMKKQDRLGYNWGNWEARGRKSTRSTKVDYIESMVIEGAPNGPDKFSTQKE